MTDFRGILFDPSNMGALGTLETSELTPIMQGDFVHGLNTQIWQTAVVSGAGAAVDTDSGRLRVQSGTGAAGYAYLLSRRPIRYRAGQGVVLKFTPIFGAGIATCLQLQGMGAIVANVIYDGYFFGYNETVFGVSHYVRGVAAHTAQTSWNGDKCDGSAGSSFTLDPTKGTPMMIKYPYLGYGDITFYIQNPTTSRWVLAHTIRYANTVATTQLSNPSLFLLSFILNSGNTTNRIMYMGSYGGFISGLRVFVGNPKWAIDNNKSGVTAETNIFSVKNCTTYNGITNRGLIRLNSISCVGDAANNRIGVFRLRIGATLGGSPVYTTINGTSGDSGVTITAGNSIASYDVAGTTCTAGNLIWNSTVAVPGNTPFDLVPYDLFVAPSEILSVSGFATAAADLSIALNWAEDI